MPNSVNPASRVPASRKVLLLELNEVNWHVVDRLIAQRGKDFLPNFARLREQGAWAIQSAVERAPNLDPWITWVTLHTGVTQAVHGAQVLEQGAESIKARRLWDRVADAGKSVGVYGSISAYPPRPVDGFIVPGPFAPGPDTFPAKLEPIQSLNRFYTKVHNGTQRGSGVGGMAMMATRLMGLGLRAGTVLRIVRHLVSERLNAGSRWKRASLQPLLNYDFFARQYRQRRPDFATWHTNHAAHYMHHYWRAWDDSEFSTGSTPEERRTYGEAVPYGYQICDELLGRFMGLLDRDTVLMVASSMGQQPFVSDRYAKGKVVVRIRDIRQFLSLVGGEFVVDAIPTMVPQWNLKVADAAARGALKARIEAVRRTVDGRSEPALTVHETDAMLTITPLGLSGSPQGVRYQFPAAPGVRADGYDIQSLFATDIPTVKQGMHHPDGMVAFFGAGIRAGVHLPACTNLDVAPTVLTLLGLPVPTEMTGRVLVEAWQAPGSGGTGRSDAAMPVSIVA